MTQRNGSIAWVPLFFLAACWTASPPASAQDKPSPAETQKDKKLELPACPVSGKPIDFHVSIPTDDGPVFFCGQGCVKQYQENPAQYAEKVAQQRKALADRPRVQVACPVEGAPPDKKVFIERDGTKVYFCCEQCLAKYKAEPAKYKSALANGYTYQTRCPVMGGEVSPKSFIELTNHQRVYFCCGACPEPFLKEPAKYLPKLVEQGIHVDPGTLPKPEAASQPASHTGH